MARAPRRDRPPNIVKDAKTVAAMVRIYCHDRHATAGGGLCSSCEALAGYADRRLSLCPFGPDKTTCRACPIHCYKPAERAAMREVMRYAGPQMIWRHPLLAIRHAWLERKEPPRRRARPAAPARPAPSSPVRQQS